MIISADEILFEGCLQEGLALDIQEQKIAAVLEADSVAVEHHLSGALVPGLIDVQVNGGGGALFNAEPTVDTIATMMAAHRRFGTTAMLPTLITDNYQTMSLAADAIKTAIDQKVDGIIGIHYEGPFLDKVKRGVHKSDYIRLPNDKELALFCRKDIGKVMLTVAPEHFPVDIIRDLAKQGVLICLGHSNASYDQTMAALDAGAIGFTHLFNAMSPLTSREPGMVGTALAHDASFAGLIVDHHHVHQSNCQVAIKSKSADNIMLVTDAMAHVGTDQQSLPFFDTVISREGDKLTIPAGNLAGSCLDMWQAVKNTHVDLGIDFADAVKMASGTPARFLGLSEEYGEIRTGARADFCLVGNNFALESVIIGGNSAELTALKQEN